ncbi:MAG: exodeoxyribonuclease V subunit beta [Acidobacteriota bacterium]|nr:MAG: exodeoxyribonuclease V subunit beta [Acidobacteriota bacterium]
MSTPNDSPRYPKPEAVLRIPEYGHAIIEASAGTGKTHTIEHLVVDLITRGIGIDEILVVTFTERATAELTRRIRSKITELLALEKTATTLSPENCWVLDDPTRERLETARTDFDRASIATIHGFCHSILMENAFLNGSLFEPRHIDDRKVFSRAFKDVLRTELARREELLPYLHAWLEVRQSNVHVLEELLYEASRQRAPVVPGFDATGLSNIASRFETTRMSSTELVARGVRRGSIAKVLRNLDGVYDALANYRRTNNLAVLVAELDEVELRYLDAQLGDFDELAAAAPALSATVVVQFLPLVLERLARMKREEGHFDFDDMLSRVDESLDGPRGAELTRMLQARYRSVLIDEFQDTDEIQWSIFRKLFFVDGAKTPLRLVGDPKQAIYGFRGADVHVYLEARSALVARSAMVPLVENFRSTPALIDALNLVFDQKAEPPFFTGNIRYDRPLRAARDDYRLIGADGGPAFPLMLVRSPDRLTLAAYIAREIEALTTDEKKKLRFGAEGDERPLGAEDIFVLTRTSREASEIGEALDARRVPYASYKQEGLFQSREAEEIRTLLAAVAEPRDRSKRLRAWMTRFFGLSLRDLEQCRNVRSDHPLMSRLIGWKELADAKDYDRLFSRILEDSGVLERELFSGRGERALVNYTHIFDRILEHVHASGASLPELIRTLSSFIEGDGLTPGSDGNVMRLESDGTVHVMTIHMAKGLEAGIVFVYGFSSGRSRGIASYYERTEKRAYVGKLADAPDDVRDAIERERGEEDQRLFYVALTRAKARLYLPLMADDGAGRGLGCYARVNRRLHELLGVFKVDEAQPDERVPEGEDVRLGDWKPPAEMLEVQDNRAAFDALGDRHRGLVVTSYSRLKTFRGGYRAPLEEPADVLEPIQPIQPIQPVQPVQHVQPVLPGGSATGIFLHDVLENVDFRVLRLDPSLETWRARGDIKALFRRAMRRNGIESRFLAEAQRIVHTTLISPVALGPHHLGGGFASLETEMREVEFVYPYPETDGKLRRGYAKGFIDFVFEVAGMTYFCDWKSDVLPSWHEDALNEHVRRNYTLQAKLYALALVKMLGIADEKDYRARVGGLVYCFVRGMPAGGIYFEQPSWTTVSMWTDELIREERL